MGDMTTLISIVLPTRDRPQYIRFALESLRLQTFDDFEVIVCDNHTGRPSKVVFDSYADERFKYFVPSQPLSMHANWEYAVSQARGHFVSVLIDKTVLRPHALSALAAAIRTHPADLYSWGNDAFSLRDEAAGDIGPGYLVSSGRRDAPAYFDPKEEMDRRLRFDTRLGREGGNYCWGKICFGAYSQNLISRIIDQSGALFAPVAPDYTSMAAALRAADRAVDINSSLLVSLVTSVSNGMAFASDAGQAKKFLCEYDPQLAFLSDLPLPGLYASVHNLIGYDYRGFFSDSRSGRAYVEQINMHNLVKRVREDLRRVQFWPSNAVRNEQFELLDAASNTLPSPDATAGTDETISTSGRSATSSLKDGVRETVVRLLRRSPALYDRVLRHHYRRNGQGFESVIDAIRSEL